MKELLIKKVPDFVLSGTGSGREWEGIAPVTLTAAPDNRSSYKTSARLAYSAGGIYLHLECEDLKISCSPQEDFGDIYLEDVFEVFFWTDQNSPLYFEYEISPLGTELVLLVPNNRGEFMGWRPWHYENDRKIIKAVDIRGGSAAPGARISGWSAEVFFPFALFKGLGNCPPESGTAWRANLYRMDYDRGECDKWEWCPTTSGQFHEYDRFGTVVFE